MSNLNEGTRRTLINLLEAALGARRDWQYEYREIYYDVPREQAEVADLAAAEGLIEICPDFPNLVRATEHAAPRLAELKAVEAGAVTLEVEPQDMAASIYLSSKTVILNGQTAFWSDVAESFDALVAAARAANEGRWMSMDRNKARRIKERLGRLHGVRNPDEVMVNLRRQGYRLDLGGKIDIVE